MSRGTSGYSGRRRLFKVATQSRERHTRTYNCRKDPGCRTREVRWFRSLWAGVFGQNSDSPEHVRSRTSIDNRGAAGLLTAAPGGIRRNPCATLAAPDQGRLGSRTGASNAATTALDRDTSFAYERHAGGHIRRCPDRHSVTPAPTRNTGVSPLNGALLRSAREAMD